MWQWKTKEKRNWAKSENETAGGWCAPAAVTAHFFLVRLSAQFFLFSSLLLCHDQGTVLHGSRLRRLACVAVPGMAISVLKLVKRTSLRNRGWAGHIQPMHTKTRSFTVGDFHLPQLEMNLILCLISSVGPSSMLPKHALGNHSATAVYYVYHYFCWNSRWHRWYCGTDKSVCALPQCYKFLEFRTKTIVTSRSALNAPDCDTVTQIQCCVRVVSSLLLNAVDGGTSCAGSGNYK